MQEPGHRFIEMTACVLTFLHGVGGPGIGHHREGLVMLDKLVHQLLEGLIVAVVIIGTMDDQEIAFQLMCKVDG